MAEPIALSVAQLRALDAFAASELGLPSCVLMENAGANAARELLATLRAQVFAGVRRPGPWRVAVLCGRGGNGGDGYVLARHVRNAGHEVTLLSAVPRAALGGDTALFRTTCERMGLSPADCDDDRAVEAFLGALESCDAIVDALLGAGAVGAPRAPLARWIQRANATSGPLKVALDLPSGLEADSGARHGEAFRADLTLSFAARKLAFDHADLAPWLGRVRVLDIGVAVPIA
jgi:NAD(P)H-hydrate epimerase